eukprot:SAG11_NODE_316_length_10846_cov_8.188239_3_plen_106_part_00
MHPVPNIDCAWISGESPPGHRDPVRTWWLKWNTDGDVSSHDNYPFPALSSSLDEFGQHFGTLDRVGGQSAGPIRGHTSPAVRANGEIKPLWLCVQALEGDAGAFW